MLLFSLLCFLGVSYALYTKGGPVKLITKENFVSEVIDAEVPYILGTFVSYYNQPSSSSLF